MTAEAVHRHNEYESTLASLSAAQEDRLRRGEAAHRVELAAAVSLEAAKQTSALQEYASSVSSLQHQLQVLSADKAELQESLAALNREHELLLSSDRSTLAKLSGMQAELAEKNRSLEAVLAQLERAELKAAKEARKRMDVERLMKRLDHSFDQLMSGAGAGVGVAVGVGAGAGAGAGKLTPAQDAATMTVAALAAGGGASRLAPSVGTGLPSSSSSVGDAAALSVQDRMRMRGWQN